MQKMKNIENKHIVWDYIKCRIRGESIQYSKQVSNNIKNQEKELINRLEVLEINMGISPDINKEIEYKLLKQNLDVIYNERAKGAIIRSRCQWIEENEKCSNYFLNLEKSNYNTKCIKSLLINNNIIENPDLILDAEKTFYKNLYTESITNSEIDIINFSRQHCDTQN